MIGTFDAPFGLRSVGTDVLDVELLQSPPKLGQTGVGDSVLGVDAKDAMLVAVECQRLAAKCSAHTDPVS